MGFVTNRWQPTSAGPGPTPVPTWELIKNGVTATTNFDFSNYDYTEYLIIVYRTASGSNTCYQFFIIPELNYGQRAGYTDIDVNMYIVTGNPYQYRFVIYSGTSTVTKNYKYTVYGRKKAAWSLVSDNNALPNYTELVTGDGYYTPFNYQDNMYRATGGSHPTSSTYSARQEKIYGNKYTFTSGSAHACTRLSSSEANWNHINSTTSSVSIENISWSEMFIVGKRIGANNFEFQAVYLISDMIKGRFNAGGCTRYQSGTANEYKDGYITVTDTSVSAYYRYRQNNTITLSFSSLDIYYR